jgi:hypothetical protein
MFASEHFGFEPDVIALAKGIASGMPRGDGGEGGADELESGGARLDIRQESGGGGRLRWRTSSCWSRSWYDNARAWCVPRG